MKERSHTNYGFEDFKSGKSKLLFVTGYSASGKSTLAKEIARKYNALYIELDLIHRNLLNGVCNPSSLEYTKDMEGVLKTFWIPFILRNKLGTIIKIDGNSNMVTNSTYDTLTVPERVKLVIEFAISLNRPCVLEGVQCYLYQELWPEILKYPVIIMNTSSLKSRISNDKRANKFQINDFMYLNRYYHRQVLLLKQFKSELERKNRTMNMEKVLESYIIASEDDHVLEDSIAQEGIFFDDKKTKTGFTADRDKTLVNTYISGKGLGFTIPSKLWPKGFLEKNASGNTYASEGMIKNGVKIITQYINTIEKLYAFTKSNHSKYVEAFNSRNTETMSSIQKQYREIASPLIATNRNAPSIFTGPQKVMPASFAKALVGPFTKYQQIFEEVTSFVAEERFRKVNQPSLIKKLIKKPQNTLPANWLYNETFLYCQDLWILVSRYLNTAK